jgi:thioredoxin
MTEKLTKQDFIDKIFDYENNKEWNYKGELPAIIDFYADWCGPCKMIGPVLEKLSEEYKEKIVIYKVNTEKEQELSGAFGVQSIPTLVFIPKSGQPQMAAGALPREALVDAIERTLLGNN